ncbi:MAG: ABC transporter ATP-binding protein [Thermodesulfovibrio sp.]|nr:ABC transporter ATP-binding protein [Thermodesulfovibrio sp.]
MLLLKFLFRNVFRHKLRTILTITGIMIAILSFGLLRTVISAWYAGVEASSSSRLVTRNAISIIFYLPLSYKEKIRQVAGVKQVSFGNWFGGIYIDEKNFIPNFIVEPKTYLDLYPEFVLKPEERSAFFRERKACIAGRKVAAKYGWKVGDTITLRGTIFPGNWELVLRGIYTGKFKSTDESQLLFRWDYVNETLRKNYPLRADNVGFYVVGVTNPDLASSVAVAIDQNFRNSIGETITETEKAFQMGFVSMSDAIIMAIQLVSFVVIVIILVVVANTMAMTVRERMGEYAIFKTLGFQRWRIALMIFGESLLLTLLGSAAGIVLTFPVSAAFGTAMGTFFPVFNVARETIYMDIAAGLAVGVLAALIPAWRTMNISIAGALRKTG